MSIRSICLLIIGCLLTIAAIAMPIYFYVNDFHDLDRSSDPSDWGTFGDFFGGILNPIFSFLTLIVTIVIAFSLSGIDKRNHEETIHNTVKPLFTIDSLDFFSADISKLDFPIGRNFFSYKRPQAPAEKDDYLSNSFFLNVHNKGLGIADRARVFLMLDLELLMEELNYSNENVVIVSKMNTSSSNQNTLLVKLIYIGNEGKYETSIVIEEQYIIGLGVVDKGELVKAVLPKRIIDVIEIYFFKQKFDLTSSFPKIKGYFDYRNIHNKHLKSNFSLWISYSGDVEEYSMFRIFYQPL